MIRHLLVLFLVLSDASMVSARSATSKKNALKGRISSRQNISSVGKYRRSDWKHWINRNGSCFNLRHEILRDRSLVPARTGRNKGFCYVFFGEWKDYYYPEKLYHPSEIDIDHIIPLKHAHLMGASHWSSELKEKFANDPENLAITNKKYNRQKKDKTIAMWLPLNIEYACRYYRDWMHIKKKYNLQISEQEVNAVDQKRCEQLDQNKLYFENQDLSSRRR